MKKILIVFLLTAIILSVTSIRSAEAAVVGSVTTDHNQYVVNVEQPLALVNIQGTIDSLSGGKIVLTIVKPDGTSDQIQTYVTSTGIFTVPYTINTSSLLGQYKVTANYQNSDFSSTIFNVASSGATTGTSTPTQPIQSQTPSVQANTSPVITSVSNIISSPQQTISIGGSGFGNQPPYINQDSAYIKITDGTRHWDAGNSASPANLVTLNIASWTNSQIVVSGFGGSYGSNDWALQYGDTIDIYVWNAQTGSGPATYASTVGMDKTTTPTVNFLPSQVNGLVVTLNANWNYPNKLNQATVDWGDNSGIVTINNRSQYTHTYSSFGTYHVTLTVYDINGLSGSSTTTVNLQPPSPPTISNLSHTVNGMTVQLFGNVNPSVGASITHTTINWGDGAVTPNGLTSYTHTYSQAGTYSVTLTAFDSNGQNSVSSTSVTVPQIQSTSSSSQQQSNPIPGSSQNQNSAIQNTQVTPLYVFNGAYANYQISYTVAGSSVSIPLSYMISNVDNSSQTFTFATNYGSSLSILSMAGLTGTFSNTSSFPAVNAEDLSNLNQGNTPSDMQGATVTKNVSISVPAGTFNTDEVTINGASKWIDTRSGLVIQQSGSFLGVSMPSLFSASIQLEKTNIPTTSSPFGNIIYLIIITIAAAGVVFFVLKKRKAKARMQPGVKETKKSNEPTPKKENKPEPAKIAKESSKTNSANLEKIEKLKKLLDSGLITQEDFDEQKRKLLDW